MAKILKKLTDLVGNTPLMELSGYCGKYGMEACVLSENCETGRYSAADI